MSEQDDIMRDQAVESICRHVIEHLDAVDVLMMDDYDDAEQPHGFDHYNGGASGCTVVRQLISASARIICRSTLPPMPAGYSLAGIDGDLVLSGPGVDPDMPDKIADALAETGILSAVQDLVKEQIEHDCLDDWRELAKQQRAWVHQMKIVVDQAGTHITFIVDVEDN